MNFLQTTNTLVFSGLLHLLFFWRKQDWNHWNWSDRVLTHWGKKQLFFRNSLEFDTWKIDKYEILEMCILWTMRVFWKLRFQKCEFCENWCYQNMIFWMKYEFFPQFETQFANVGYDGLRVSLSNWSLFKKLHDKRKEIFRIVMLCILALKSV